MQAGLPSWQLTVLLLLTAVSKPISGHSVAPAGYHRRDAMHLAALDRFITAMVLVVT